MRRPGGSVRTPVAACRPGPRFSAGSSCWRCLALVLRIGAHSKRLLTLLESRCTFMALRPQRATAAEAETRRGRSRLKALGAWSWRWPNSKSVITLSTTVMKGLVHPTGAQRGRRNVLPHVLAHFTPSTPKGAVSHNSIAAGGSGATGGGWSGVTYPLAETHGSAWRSTGAVGPAGRQRAGPAAGQRPTAPPSVRQRDDANLGRDARRDATRGDG